VLTTDQPATVYMTYSLIAENAIHGIGREELAATGFQIAGDRFADRFVLTGRTLHAIGG
jgi:hypothetical protein